MDKKCCSKKCMCDEIEYNYPKWIELEETPVVTVVYGPVFNWKNIIEETDTYIRRL